MEKKITSLLRKLEKTQKTYWNIPKEVGLFLNQLIRIGNYKTVLEIGTSNGYSGMWLAEALSLTGGQLYTIESNLKKRYPLATKTFATSGLTNITQILGHAPEAIPLTPHTFDLVFLDATKHEHPEYLKILAPRIRKGGMIITDNAISHSKELTPYFKTIDASQAFTSHLLDIGTGLMISLKMSA